MEDEIFEMDKLAVEPEGGTGVGELHASSKPADRRVSDVLVKARPRDAEWRKRPQQTERTYYEQLTI
ncbi:hypothetical protein ABIA24_005741 [Sinorhizobium fredii]|uniref:Uncharacterized protein n=1 Tax=Rhizobium fredii TaxID=380 RepID=A0A844A5H8_RHIFR|nr:hypothetical protein SF83666_b48700 [Sinorhizobium fredii CCBAU 83666]MQX08364.1 hypothetical protein [Sinorhizobium fredii]GEC34181.1 hypothetical protein EFR01_43520 [Sinorhizobium fredii]GLS08202.1 hypothetical protein GCM10007864_18310 [Sinorhizobium fredii]